MPTHLDGLRRPVELPEQVTRVVCLVPSITEAIAVTAPSALVGATDWCTHPAGLEVTRVRGTKNPSLEAIRALRPQVVVANQEENRELDVRRLGERGIAVWVTRIHTVEQAFLAYGHMFTAFGWVHPPWLAHTREAWAEVDAAGASGHRGQRVVVPIWRDPWMVVGSDTFAGDVLERLGYVHHYTRHAQRYPHIDAGALDDPAIDQILLPDEPYSFGPTDAATLSRPSRLISGRLLTWYGPSLLQLARQGLGRG